MCVLQPGAEAIERQSRKLNSGAIAFLPGKAEQRARRAEAIDEEVAPVPAGVLIAPSQRLLHMGLMI